MNSWETRGQMLMHRESMNSSTTALPRKPDSDSTRPSWSVSVKPGAAPADAGESRSRVAVPDGMAARRPAEAASSCCRPDKTTTAATAATADKITKEAAAQLDNDVRPSWPVPYP